MRCRMCGKQLENGTLCDECYNQYTASDSVPKNTEKVSDQIIYKVDNKYIPKFYLLKNWEWFLFGFIVIISSFLSMNVATIISTILLIFALIGGSLIIVKRLALASKCVFLENRVIYTFNFLFIHKKKVLEYKDLEDITYNQTFMQKKFKMGNINVIGKRNGVLFNGFILKNIPNIEEVFKTLTQKIGDKII